MTDTRAGFVSFVGRPNVGKSTLMNALVGEKIAITSSKPQTTRRAIRGIIDRADGQVIIVDTPGVHRPRTLLGERLNSLVETVLGDVDVIALCVPATERIGPGDRYINAELDKYPRARKVAVVTQCDKASRAEHVEQLAAVSGLRDWDVIIPVSAVTGEQCETLAEQLVALMPPSPRLYPASTVTDQERDDRLGELIREAALEGVSDELPHSIAVVVDAVEHDPSRDLTSIYASLYVERASQKAIVIGRKGTRLRAIGTASRPGIEELIGGHVYLSLHVKVAKEWQRDAKALGKLGF